MDCCCGHKRNSVKDVSNSRIDVSVPIEEVSEYEQPEESTRNTDENNADEETTTDHRRQSRTSSRSLPSNILKMLFHASSGNRFALKLYGNEQGIFKEQRRQDKHFCSRWMIHPFSHFRWYWDLVMVFLLVFTITVLPVSITYFGDELNYSWVAINALVDLLFITDIIINFRTGVIAIYPAPDYVILASKKVAKHYLKGWFVVDLISSIPFDQFILIATRGSAISPSVLQVSRALRILRLAKMLSLLKLLRISRLLRYIRKWEDLFNLAGGFLRIFKLILLMLLLAHWNGCIQFLVPILQGVPDRSWVAINKLQNASVIEQYSWSLFKAISHMLCIGFGRWPPQNITETWLTIVSMMVGATFYALFIGNMSTLLLSIDTSGRLYNEKLNQVEEYMHHLKLPQEIRQNVTDYYEHRFKNKYFNEQQIIAELSQGLQEDIANHTCKDLVESVSFFKRASPQFILAVVMKLKFEVFMKNEYIVRAGTRGDRMFFLKDGAVEIIVDGKVAATLSDGSHFGEICLLTDDRRVADIVTLKTTDVFSLSKLNFDILLDEYPDMRREFENVAMKRLSNIGHKASIFEFETHPCRPRISTRIRPPPSIIISKLDSTTDSHMLKLPVERHDYVDQTVKRFQSEPVPRTTTTSISNIPLRSFSETGRRKLPPLKIKKVGEPSDNNPNLIEYPQSDDENN